MKARHASIVVVTALSSLAVFGGVSTVAERRSRAVDATPAQMEEAHARFEKGLALFREGAFEAAAAEFERSYQIAPSFKILYNLGLAYARANDFAAAWKTYRRYLGEGGADVPADRRASVEHEVAELETKIARLQIDVNVAGAALTVDDVLVGKSPLAEPIVVNPGRHKVGAMVGATAPMVEVITLVSAESRTVAFTVVEVAPPKRDEPVAPEPSVSARASAPTPSASSVPSASTTPQPPQLPPAETNDTRIWAGWTTTGAMIAAGGVFGAIALHQSHALASARDDGASTRASLDDLQRSTRRYALAADLFFGASLVCGGLSIYWTLHQDAPSERDATATAVGLIVAPGHVAFDLRF